MNLISVPNGCGSKKSTVEANRRLCSMFTYQGNPFWDSGFLSHSHSPRLRQREPPATIQTVPGPAPAGLAKQLAWVSGFWGETCQQRESFQSSHSLPFQPNQAKTSLTSFSRLFKMTAAPHRHLNLVVVGSKGDGLCLLKRAGWTCLL